MLMKLTMANIKSHLRDYIVLLTGLVTSSAIFYMFANLATNQALIKSNLNFKFASAVFIFGLILLAIITLVYVMYANQFLLNMRQHDYDLFMMLGAKKSRVSQLFSFGNNGSWVRCHRYWNYYWYFGYRWFIRVAAR